MPDFEDLRLADLIRKFRKEIEEIALSRNVSGFKKAAARLQDVYNFHIAAENSYAKQEELFKNLYTSFNYAAVIVNNALKEGGLRKDDNELLQECIEILLKCSDKILQSLQ